MMYHVTFAVESSTLTPKFFDGFGELSRYLIRLPESCFPVEVSIFPNGRIGAVKSIAPFSIGWEGSVQKLASQINLIFQQLMIVASSNMENGALYSPYIKLFEYEEDIKWSPTLYISKIKNGKECKILSSNEVYDLNDVLDANALWLYVLYMDLISTPIGRNA